MDWLERIIPVLGMLVVGAYWARVLKMAHKQKKRTGQAANLIPAETLGRVLRIVWFPLIVSFLIQSMLLAAQLSPLGFLTHSLLPGHFGIVLGLIGVKVAAGALGLSFLCWKKMGKAWRMGINPAEQNELILTGPYQWVRHPIYALSMLLMVGVWLTTPTPLMGLCVLLHIALLAWEAKREEQHMTKIHGPAYSQYLKNVKGFVPGVI